MTEIDIKLLRVFLEIHKCRNISQAAVVLGLTQPTISFYLSRLRTHYGDQLFVRASREMLPTPFAEELYRHAQQAVAAIEAANHFHVEFDPASSDREFAMATTDISHRALLPRLLNRLTSIGPNVGLKILHIEGNTRLRLESGEIDVAVGFMPQLDAGFYEQKMFRQRYVCILARDAARNTPSGGEALDLETFLSCAHIRVFSGGSGHFVIEKLLREQQINRRVQLELPNYLGLIEIVGRTKLMAIVPVGLTWSIAPSDDVDVFELPEEIQLPNYDVKQYWHERNHRDPAHRWLRSVLTDLFLERGDPTPAGVGPDGRALTISNGDDDDRTLP